MKNQNTSYENPDFQLLSNKRAREVWPSCFSYVMLDGCRSRAPRFTFPASPVISLTLSLSAKLQLASFLHCHFSHSTETKVKHFLSPSLYSKSKTKKVTCFKKKMRLYHAHFIHLPGPPREVTASLARAPSTVIFTSPFLHKNI